MKLLWRFSELSFLVLSLQEESLIHRESTEKKGGRQAQGSKIWLSYAAFRAKLMLPVNTGVILT